MSIIGKNIKKIRTIKKISQADFADLFQISRASVGSYEEGRAEPKIDTIIRIANHFSLSIDLLLTKELTINELYKFDIFREEYQQETAHVLTDRDASKYDTPLVTKENYLEYIVNYQHKDYVNRLPCIVLPFMTHEKARAFEVQDNAMAFNSRGLSKGDILACSAVEGIPYANLSAESIYVIVTRKEIMVRRLASERPNLTFTADNAGFDSTTIEQDAILELWKVEGFYSTLLDPPVLIEERMAMAEKRISTLEWMLERLDNRQEGLGRK